MADWWASAVWVRVGYTAAFLAAGIAVAVVTDYAWSWPLFLWGVLLAPLRFALAWFLGKGMRRGLTRVVGDPASWTPDQVEHVPDLLTRASGVSKRRLELAQQRVGFRWWLSSGVTSLFFYAGVGAFSGGLHNAAPDVIISARLLVSSVYKPLATYGRLKEELIALRSTVTHHRPT